MKPHLLLACALTAGCDLGASSGIDCAAVALRDAAGDPDGCDVAACATCVDTCGRDCAILESYPPQYSCGGDAGLWDVYAFCPDWTLPTTPTTAAIAATNVADLGCGTSTEERLAAAPTGPGAVAVVHDDYAVGCCPDGVTVAVVAKDQVLTVSYTVGPDPCDCVCGLDLTYDLVGVPAGDWTLVAGPSGASTLVTVP